ncbi:MAG TPA: glycoside hydrolase domain-containing protein [Thermoguttaceae bacterium]|nr:glycoside hydrolase domain-containing protein [Thermoguttaceae bacterium]
MNVPSIVSATAKLALAISLLATATAAEPFTPIANPDFTQGDDAPAGWQLSGGQGRWVDRNILEVTGSGDDSNFWRTDCAFEPAALYRFSMRARQVGGSGCVVSGPAFANRDWRLSTEWQWCENVFRVPEGTESSYVRLGQWQATGTVQFDAVRLVRVIPVHKKVGDVLLGEGESTKVADVLLGEGESVRDGRYTFSGTFGDEGGNYHRVLHAATAGFNSDRWTFGSGDQVTYRFALPGCQFQSGKLSFNVNYHIRGGCIAEVSRNMLDWRLLTTQSEVGTAQAELPADLFRQGMIYLPDDAIYLRLRSSAGSSFQVNRVEFEAGLRDSPPDAIGETLYGDLQGKLADFPIETIVMERDQTTGRARLNIEKTALKSIDVRCSLSTGGEVYAGADVSDNGITIREDELPPGRHKITITLETRPPIKGAPPDARLTITLPYDVPDYHRSDYGQRIAGFGLKADVWWCDATHKVWPQRPLPPPDPQAKRADPPAARLAAARNDREAVQVVLRPTDPLVGLTAVARDFSASDGATIPAENVSILRVAYHFVHHPTDNTGIRDWWPDALPPLTGPIDLERGKNQPLWVLVHVPKDARPGDYTGAISLKAEDFSAEVPIKLHVWDFTLPERNHLETAFGLSAGNVYRYHGLKTEEDKRRVLDLYFRNFAEHRISPYDPAPLDPIRVKFLSDADPPGAELDFSAFDPAMTRAVETFRFTGFRLPIQGMGGGTFHARVDPRIGNFTEDTPEYQAMFSSYVGQLEEHFRQKGWLDEAYVYWFDEPAPKDYQFVADGMKRLKQYAPGLRRMLTEEPGDNPLAGTVDVWCPVSNNYNHEEAERRRAHGERFWWYVCCGPKAPYCTLFIDHPATELRVWLWQTWQRKIDGILVWSSNYWTSSAAFPDPDRPQNPYEDPMGYVSGYSTPEGTKRYWGNGDGRFVYPAESAAVPGLSGERPVIEPPVSSIRWEMLREGIEDYEFLYMLRELLDKRRKDLRPEEIEKYEALLEVPESITADMTTFTTDPAPIYARRTAIAEAIERLTP